MKFVAECKVMGNTIMLQTNSKVNLDDGNYLIDISDYSKNRSLSQNALMWKLINEISKKINGNTKDSKDIYTQILQMAGVKYTFVEIDGNVPTKDFENMIEGYVKELTTYGTKKTLQVFAGTSKMDTKEMSKVIETTIEMAEHYGINTDSPQWKALLND